MKEIFWLDARLDSRFMAFAPFLYARKYLGSIHIVGS